MEAPQTPFDTSLQMSLSLAQHLENVARYAMTDQMTGLYRMEDWKSLVSERIEAKDTFGVLFIDLNAFKAVNDELGHEEGNILLAEFATFLSSKFTRSNDAAAHRGLMQAEGDAGRLGGDEFGVIVDLSKRQPDDELTPQQKMNETVSKLESDIRLFLNGLDSSITKLNFGASIGSAVWQQGMTCEELIAQADHAMSKNKTEQKAERLSEGEVAQLIVTLPLLQKAGIRIPSAILRQLNHDN